VKVKARALLGWERREEKTLQYQQVRWLCRMEGINSCNSATLASSLSFSASDVSPAARCRGLPCILALMISSSSSSSSSLPPTFEAI